MSEWSLSCQDWEERLIAGRSLVPDLPLDQAEATRAVRIFNLLRLPDVPGTPRLADAGADWFREIVAALFGSLDRDSNTRMIKEVFLLAPKKSSKTSYGAALMLTALLMNARPRAEFLLIAPTQAISELAFSQAVGMIEADTSGFLKDRMKVRDHVKLILDQRTKATLKIKTFDSGVLTGVKPAGVLVDELHEISRSADAARVIGQIRGGLLPNPESFLVFITTQSDLPPAGAFRAELMHARAVRDGRVRGRTLPVLYEFPESMVKSGKWRDPSCWWMVSPNRGRSMTVESLVPEWEKAQEAGEEEIRRWASQHLNVEIGLALRSDRWAGADHWLQAGDRSLTLEVLLARSDAVVVGIDGGGLDDLLGVAVLGRDRDTRGWLLWNHAFAHPVAMERRKQEAPRYLDFAADGDLTIVESLPNDISGAVEIVETVKRAGLLAGVGLDQIGLGGIVDALAEIEVTQEAELVFGISQGWKMANAIKTVERKLADGTLVHSDLPMMAWVVGNAKIEPRGNAIAVTKQAAGYGKIDPLVATFNAAELMARNPAPKGAPAIFIL